MSAGTTPIDAEGLLANYNAVNAKIDAATGQNAPRPTLVAVSKTKPNEMIQVLYDAGHRRFGENYAQELVRKAGELPKDIEWSFIGHLQTNKVKQICAIPNLVTFQTVDSPKIANALNKACANIERDPLNVFVQVNTSGEESKSGVAPDACADLALHVATHCPALRVAGLMTIGRPQAPEDQPDFVTLMECRQKVGEALKVDASTLEVSMGMSNDYEDAIRFGSTNVRVGSSIFGSRAK